MGDETTVGHAATEDAIAMGAARAATDDADAADTRGAANAKDGVATPLPTTRPTPTRPTANGRRTRLPPALPTLALAPASLANLDADLTREWLVANGLGGYAMGTVAGATTRSYHGWLVAALAPPLGRTTLVTKADETVRLADRSEIALGTNEYADGTINPRGFERLTAFALEGLIPCATYWLGAGATLTRRLWMEHGHNLTYVQYTYQVDRALATLATLPPGESVSRGARPSSAGLGAITLTVSPYCVTRDHHSSVRATPDQRFLVTPLTGPDGQANAGSASQVVRANADAPPIHLLVGPAARFEETGVWYWRVEHRAERLRGLADVEDVYQPGVFSVTLTSGQTATFAFYTPLPAEAPTADEVARAIAGLGGAQHEELAAAARAREQVRQRALLECADMADVGRYDLGDALTQRLILAADQFLVVRKPPTATPGSPAEGAPTAAAGATSAPTQPPAPPTTFSATPTPTTASAATTAPATSLASATTTDVTVIAGYPWFTDWGRDTMIALPGLTLATGRYTEARGLLRCFVGAMSQGMIPNRFPDGPTDATPEYNTVDATLWLFHALDAYLTATDDWPLLAELFASLAESVAWHERGTRYGIGVDPADGLLRAGVADAAGVQLTWMDAKVGDWVVTPRRGKPVEINALWYHALTLMGGWARRLGQDAADYDRLRAQVEAHFMPRFWYDAGGYLYDVVDVDGVAGAVDWSLRPNQVIALAVAPSLIPSAQARRILAVTERELLTPLGLRTLAPSDPRFIGVYSGDQRARDAAYHQGTVWPWLLGPYADAHAWVHGAATDAAQRESAAPDGSAPRQLGGNDGGNADDVIDSAPNQHGQLDQRERAWRAALLAPFRAHLREAGLGSVSEIAEGAAPFAPRGCPAQAWSVAELLHIALL